MTGPKDSNEAGARTLDPAVLAGLRRALDDDTLVAEIIEAFLADTPGQIASLAAAGAQEDLPAVVATAHHIKSSALTFGAVRMVRLCSALESEPGESRDLVPAVAREFDELSRSLSTYLQDLSGAG